MAAIFDTMGNYVGDDSSINDWDDNTTPYQDSLDVNTPSPFNIDYYRQKAIDFQTMLNCLNITVDSAWNTLEMGCTEETTQEIYNWLGDVDAQKTQMRIVAKTLNVSSDALGVVGVNFPKISYPGGLAAFWVPAAGVVAIAAAATLISWGYSAIEAYKQIRMRELTLDNASPETKQLIVQDMTKTDNAIQTQQAKSGGAVGQVADTVKLLAFVAAGFMALQAIK